MDIGVFGGKGFIGSHLSRSLEDPQIFNRNMRSLNAVAEFVEDKNIIYHVAGKNREPQYGDIMYNNIRCTANLVVACKRLKIDPYIVFISSAQVLTNPDSEYGITKRIEERMIMDNFSKWTIVRSVGVFGPGARSNYNSVVATVCHAIAKKLPYVIHDRSTEIRLIYIDNLIKKILKLKPGRNRVENVKGRKITLGEMENILLSEDSQGDFGETLKWYKK
jgi:UDP-2-acetamido-2,6-beta-L-arabino-hexul-4-ose reductase